MTFIYRAFLMETDCPFLIFAVGYIFSHARDGKCLFVFWLSFVQS